MKLSECVALLPRADLVRLGRSHGAAGELSRDDDELRDRLLVRAEHLADTRRVAHVLRNQTVDRGDRVLVETLLTALLLSPDLASEEDHLYELVRGFEQSIIDEAAETGTLGYAGTHPLYSGALEGDGGGGEGRSMQSGRGSPTSIDSTRQLSRRSQHVLEATLCRFPKPGNILHSLAEFLNASRTLQRSAVLFRVVTDDRQVLIVLPDEISAAVKVVLGFELKPEQQRLLQDGLSTEQLVRALEARRLSTCGPKSDLNDRLIKSEVRPSEVLSLLSNVELGSLCEEAGISSKGDFKQDRIRALIAHYDALVVDRAVARRIGCESAELSGFDSIGI
jgi:hypothetical protein